VFAGHVDALCRTADDLRAHPDPDVALFGWLRAVLRHATAHRGLGTALAAAADPAPLAAFHRSIEEAGEALLDRARRAGVVRDGIEIGELLRLVGAIGATAEGWPDGPARAERLLDIAVDGVRAPVGDG